MKSMEGIYERYINYGEFKELVEGKDEWVRDLMMSIGLGDIRSRCNPLQEEEHETKYCFHICAFEWIDCFYERLYFPDNLEEDFFSSATKIFNHFKSLKDYDILCDYRSRLASYKNYVSDSGRLKKLIREIDICMLELMDKRQDINNELLIQHPCKKPEDYPPVSEAQLSYISGRIVDSDDRIWLLHDETKKKLYRRIYDITEAWEMADRTAPRKWRTLLELLYRSGVVKTNETTKFRDFASNIVGYCIGDVLDSIRKRIGNCFFEDSFINWSKNDKETYGNLKKELFKTL